MKDYQWNMHPNQAKSLMLARRQLAELVCDAVNLEGLHFTLPEIQTLLDGITVGGHKLIDQQMALNQAEAWRTLFGWVEADQFEITPQTACALHGIAGRQEAPCNGAHSARAASPLPVRITFRTPQNYTLNPPHTETLYAHRSRSPSRLQLDSRP